MSAESKLKARVKLIVLVLFLIMGSAAAMIFLLLTEIHIDRSLSLEMNHAVASGNIKELRGVLKMNPTQSSKAHSLNLAITLEQTQSARILLKAGADPDFKIRNGNTARQSAASSMNPEIRELLTEMGSKKPESK